MLMQHLELMQHKLKVFRSLLFGDWTKLSLFVLDSSTSSKLLSLEVQWGSSLIDAVLPQEET